MFLIALAFKLTTRYHPSVYNYESYLAPEIVEKLKKNYNYKEFKEINEFTQALTQDKAIAGVGSDFQTAQLILDKKIKKINYTRIFGTDTNNWENRKKFFTKNVQDHLNKFNELVFNKLVDFKKNNELHKYGFELDINNKKWRSLETKKKNPNEWDHFSDYILPYYIQDKGVAYNINKYTRPNLNIEDATKKFEEKEKNFKWNEIFFILKKNNYKYVAWTNAFVDNLMIGAMNYSKKSNNPDEWKKIFTINGEGKLFNFNNDNYKLAIDSFIDFVKEASGSSIRDTKHNFLSGDGLELLNHLIEPKEGRSDSAVIYNGDALDAYYSKDNFASVEEGYVRFERPKYNYILMDGWIISSKLTNEEENKFLDTLKMNIYHNNYLYSNKNIDFNNLNLTKLESIFIKKVQEFIDDEAKENALKTVEKIFNNNEAREIVINELNKDENLKQINWNLLENWKNEINKFIYSKDGNYWNWLSIIRKNSDDGYSIFENAFTKAFGHVDLSEIANFDYISYTPADLLTYSFIEKWYFGNDETAKNIYAQPSENDDYKLFTYPIIDNNLRTKIASYYFEKTKS
ncbi:hypothetical protein [Metamycoplasma canadense]|uniref:hypothetical protein n=1 Tax=Metamycoplasma canadense TaxID=29554 RepID=UPI001E5C037E|nr:hypothetical protein [Metamycoplasma canadense]